MEQPNRIINVAGDYVQSKHVDYEINNVEAGGIGIQIVNNSQPTINPPQSKPITPKKPHIFSKHPLSFIVTSTLTLIAISESISCIVICAKNIRKPKRI